MLRTWRFVLGTAGWSLSLGLMRKHALDDSGKVVRTVGDDSHAAADHGCQERRHAS